MQRWKRLWRNRWTKVGAIAFGIFLINGLARWISLLAEPDRDPLSTAAPVETTGQKVIAVVGLLAAVGVFAWAAAVRAMRHPVGRVVADVGAATIAGTVLALCVGPFFGGEKPFADGLEAFVYQFFQFLALGAIGIVLGFTAMVVLGKDWKTRGLAAYTERYERRAHRTAADTGRRR